MEFRFETRQQAKQSPFFFTEEECNNGGTAYGWSIIIEDEQTDRVIRSVPPTLDSSQDPVQWDAYCAALARRFSKRNHPMLHYEDLFQEARLKVCSLLAAQSFPLARPDYQITDQYQELSEDEITDLSDAEFADYRALQDNIRFRSSLRRSLIDYIGKMRHA